MKSGIYKITNLKNNKKYIGQSINIEKRFSEHKRNAFNKNTHTYEYPLYRAIRKYGLENFSFEVLEYNEINTLTEREQYYIDKYNTLNPNYGYNQEKAIDPKKGEDCNFAKLKNKEVEIIKKLIKNTNLLFTDIAEMYQVSSSVIEDINKGYRWTDDINEYPIRKNARSFAHQGERQNTAKLTEEEVIMIRKRYVSETISDIFKDYKSKISFSAFKKICYGVTWKHLPCYKKNKKIWVHN